MNCFNSFSPPLLQFRAGRARSSPRSIAVLMRSHTPDVFNLFTKTHTAITHRSSPIQIRVIAFCYLQQPRSSTRVSRFPGPVRSAFNACFTKGKNYDPSARSLHRLPSHSHTPLLHTRIDYTGFNALFDSDGDFVGITPATGEISYGQFFLTLHAPLEGIRRGHQFHQ